jgi:hypothetical protein
MDQVCYVLPIRPGQTEAARALIEEIRTARWAEYAATQRRMGAVKEVWFLATGPAGDQLVVYLEVPDFAAALAAYTGSTDPFDAWFNGRLAEVTGFEAGDAEAQAAAALPERLLSYGG